MHPQLPNTAKLDLIAHKSTTTTKSAEPSSMETNDKSLCPTYEDLLGPPLCAEDGSYRSEEMFGCGRSICGSITG